MKKNTVTPIRKPLPPTPGFSPRFTREGLDSLIDVVCKKTVATIRAREAAELLRERTAAERKAEPEYQAQMKWARDKVRGVIITPAAE